MDEESHSTLWTRLSSLFSGKGEDHLEQAIMDARAEGELKAEEGSMLLSVLSLDELQAQDIMTPRTDLDCIPSGSTILETAKAIVDTGHSRLPVYKETKDNIIGIVYAKDLLRSLIDPAHHDGPVDPLMREPFFVPETKLSSELLQEFRSRKNHLAIVVDEYGGTSGIATIEDLVEIIVGDIEDEHDTPKEDDIQPQGNNCFQLSGRAYLEDLEALGINLASEEVDTIGGYLCLHAGHVPQIEESFTFGEWVFTVIEADAKQIRKIDARKAGEQESAA